MSTTLQSIDLPTGVRLPYIEQGERDGVPVVLLHGYSDSLRSWDLLRPLLPPGMWVIAPSQRGHGNASRPAAGYGTAEFAGDLAAFLDALGIDSAVIVGHSLGSLVGARFALDYPERTRGLVLIGAMTSLATLPGFDEMVAYVETLADPVDTDFIREFQESTIANPLPPDFFATVLRESALLPAHVWQGVARELIAEDRTALLTGISAPTLVLWGDRDETAPRRDQDILAASITGSHLTIYDGLGHAPHWEDPARVARDLVAFVAEV